MVIHIIYPEPGVPPSGVGAGVAGVVVLSSAAFVPVVCAPEIPFVIAFVIEPVICPVTALLAASNAHFNPPDIKSQAGAPTA